MPAPAWSQNTGGEVLYNGIVLPTPWPPRRRSITTIPERAPYLASPPDVIKIDIGRQLFVDDFLIEESSLYRRFHQATYHPSNPVLAPVRDWERRDPFATTTGNAPSPTAMVFSDGVFYDPAQKLFKMWYMAGYQQHTALAVSPDGITWERPAYDVVAGTNIVSTQGRDSSTVWLDLDDPDPRARYKMAAYDLNLKALRLSQSGDGVHWREMTRSGPCGDRSTMFRNPFRRVWTFSLRADAPNSLYRFRRYAETKDFLSAAWTETEPVAVAQEAKLTAQLDFARAEFLKTLTVSTVLVSKPDGQEQIFALQRGLIILRDILLKTPKEEMSKMAPAIRAITQATKLIAKVKAPSVNGFSQSANNAVVVAGVIDNLVGIQESAPKSKGG